MFNKNVVVLYYLKNTYFVNFGEDVGSSHFSSKDRYFVKNSKEDSYFGNECLLWYFQPKTIKLLLGKGFKVSIFKDTILSSGQIIWQSTNSADGDRVAAATKLA
ncbi:hypothetical protein F7734_34160 [Scytonema sp. UIC 10036]|uniref:hypothetical protein n=1 Tax=Scytonema sp. UIC 10036 TaxID=2304196 RepID=UPI0012DAB9C3|nr:hypothetical protein [Scytonema sp. UIC 10036]MUG97106.1 hypothetical protein [Scytonema sp. UIC 10036]